LDEQKLEQGAPLICMLGEKSPRAWWDCHEGESVDTTPFDPNDIDINPELPQPFIDKVKAAIKEHMSAFEGHNNTLPKPFDAPPVELKFKPDASPQSVPELGGLTPSARSSGSGPKTALEISLLRFLSLLGHPARISS
jgi:hypothetical protein